MRQVVAWIFLHSLVVFDSGIGGLTVVKELLRIMPDENFIYFGDMARTPYGSRSSAVILRFMHQILRLFAAQQVKQVVFACNTMTALSCEEARKRYPFLVVGTNTGVRSALKATHNKSIGVIATQGTIINLLILLGIPQLMPARC